MLTASPLLTTSIMMIGVLTFPSLLQAKYHQLITTSIMMFDVLPCLFYHNNAFVKQAALEVIYPAVGVAIALYSVGGLVRELGKSVQRVRKNEVDQSWGCE